MSEGKSSNPLDKLPIPEHLRRPLLFGLAALLGLLGAWQLWNGYRAFQGAQEADSAIAVRDSLASNLAQRLDELRKQFDTLLADPYLDADLRGGAYAEAAERLRKNWPALRDAAAYQGELDDAYREQEAGKLGFDRLAVLSAALNTDGVSNGVAGARDAKGLGLARALRDGDKVVAVAYAELPLDTMLAPVQSAAIGKGYLELRAGKTVLASAGNAELKNVALPTPIKDSPFLLAAASAMGRSDESPVVAGGFGLVLLLGAGVLVWLQRKSGAGASAAADEPTLADALAQHKRVAAGEAAESKPAAAPAAPPARIQRSIFRAYDIRGVVGDSLDPGIAKLIGQAVGSQLREQGLREIVVGRDGRLSGPALSTALIEGLRSTGCDVIDIGLAPTPLIYFGTYQLNTGSCIAVTGSHNPPDYNGFKIMVGGETLSGDAIQALYTRIAENRLQTGGNGGLQVMDLSRDYIDRIASDIQLERRMKVVIDCGNGVAGALAPDVLEAIGCAAELLFCDVDGNFPNHHPDPSDPHNLRDLITAVQRTGAELGLAFDGDGDRLGVVTRQGEVIFPDRVLMLFAQDVLSRNPGAAVIYDVKCTGHLSGQILRHGGSPIMWKTGHSLIKAKMKETEAELAGEMSGHFFFRERWFGFDDGIYSACRLLEILAGDERAPEEIFAELPKGVSTPELKINMQEGEHYAFIERFREKARFEGAKIVTIDGVRADWPDGWGLVRCSNTTPSLVLRFDADNQAALIRIQGAFRTQIEAVQAGLKLPF